MYNTHSQSQKDPKTPEEIAKEKEKAFELKSQLDDFLLLRKGKLEVSDNIKFSSLIVQLSPEFYTAFNFRKEQFLKKWEQTEPKLKYKELKDELAFIFTFQKYHPKNYTLWQHRLWLVERSKEIENEIELVEKINEPLVYQLELGLCSKMLEKDERNFHVWNYRNWLIKLVNNNSLIEKEIQFCDNKIEKNFSNYSAFHFKDKNLRRKFTKTLIDNINSKTNEMLEIFKYGYPLEIIKKEIEKIKVAIIMEPNEQGVWFYLKNLLNIYFPAFIKLFQISKINETWIIEIAFNKEVFGFSNSNLSVNDSNGNKIPFSVEQKGKFSNIIRVSISINDVKDYFEIEVFGSKDLFEFDLMEKYISEENLITKNVSREKIQITIDNGTINFKLISFETDEIKLRDEIVGFLKEVEELEGFNKNASFLKLNFLLNEFYSLILKEKSLNGKVLLELKEIQVVLDSLISNLESKKKYFSKKKTLISNIIEKGFDLNNFEENSEEIKEMFNSLNNL